MYTPLRGCLGRNIRRTIMFGLKYVNSYSFCVIRDS